MPIIKNRKFIVEETEETGKRLDVFLSEQFVDITRSQIKKLIESGAVQINGKVEKASYKVNELDVVFCELAEECKPQEIVQKNIEVPVLYEDSHLIVINKPPGLVTHPGAGDEEESVVHAFYNKLYKNHKIRPGVVHRLDKETQGLLVLAKSHLAYESLVLQFKERVAKRTYIAFCFGNPKKNEGTIESYLQRNPRDRKKYSSQAEGKKAITHYKVLLGGQVSKLELNLETGRTHQIRVHLSELGHSIVNDTLYGSLKQVNGIADSQLKAKIKKMKNLMLVAARLQLIHPRSGMELKFSIDIPDEFVIL